MAISLSVKHTCCFDLWFT